MLNWGLSEVSAGNTEGKHSTASVSAWPVEFLERRVLHSQQELFLFAQLSEWRFSSVCWCGAKTILAFLTLCFNLEEQPNMPNMQTHMLFEPEKLYRYFSLMIYCMQSLASGIKCANDQTWIPLLSFFFCETLFSDCSSNWFPDTPILACFLCARGWFMVLNDSGALICG